MWVGYRVVIGLIWRGVWVGRMYVCRWVGGWCWWVCKFISNVKHDI